MTTILDHLAIGTPALSDGWELFGAVLGGTWAYGGSSPGFWWGQLEFLAGPKIELLTPTGGPGGAFLDRFLAARGAGPHHFNFLVTDIETALARIKASGITSAILAARCDCSGKSSTASLIRPAPGPPS
jgi:Glyoxalase/Bleomycin resistance protein/Dioxygenase superfamily